MCEVCQNGGVEILVCFVEAPKDRPMVSQDCPKMGQDKMDQRTGGERGGERAGERGGEKGGEKGGENGGKRVPPELRKSVIFMCWAKRWF